MTSQVNPATDHPASRPAPGPAGVRPIWDGQQETPPPLQDGANREILGPANERWSTDQAFGPSGNPKRIVGIDAARGFALLGMVAIHTLPVYSPYTGRPTAVWQLFAGNAAALFALLAGISVALITGANNPYTGRRMKRSRVSLTIRAFLILALGLGISELPLVVYNILPYYGLMFLFAVALSGMRIRGLLVTAGAFIALGPFVIFLVNSRIVYTEPRNPNFTSLFTLPGDTLLTLFAGGTYPVVTWMAYICVGMALGRMNLRWLLTEARLIFWGLVLIVVSSIASWFLIDYLGGFEALYALTEGYDEEAIIDTIDYGPDKHLPTDTLWWLAIDGPHTNTPFSVAKSLGFALVFFGIMLVVARSLRHLVFPLIAAGSMTLTIYVTHLVALAYFYDSVKLYPTLWLLGQVVTFLVFASFWHLAFGQGPLERIVSTICRRGSKRLVPITAKPKEPREAPSADVTAEEAESPKDADRQAAERGQSSSSEQN